MSSAHVGRNAPCLCGSGEKYKRCCLGKLDWDILQNQPLNVQTRHLTVRGKNLVFLTGLCAALQIDPSSRPLDFSNFKRAFTPEAVREIYAIIPPLWPDYNDYVRALSSERDSVSALYTGTYTPDAVLKAVTRHSLYS